MNFSKFMEGFANEIGGQFSEYDKTKSIIVFPLGENRFQTVLGIIKPIGKNAKPGIIFSSKVCALSDAGNFNPMDLLKEQSDFLHAKFIEANDFIQVAACTVLENVTDRLLKDIITEVAHVADEWEYKLTGLDVH